MIHADGVDTLTLRGVGARLGVSRTALYRHFSDKRALLAAVAAEGFATLRRELLAGWNDGAHGAEGLAAMGDAYVRFAVTHPSHYRVMFGGALDSRVVAPDVDGESTDAFGVLLDAITEQQRAGIVRPDDPLKLALFVWAEVHGIAMLALSGVLPTTTDAVALMDFANARLRTGIAAPVPTRRRGLR